jgi:hypothetical protein
LTADGYSFVFPDTKGKGVLQSKDRNMLIFWQHSREMQKAFDVLEDSNHNLNISQKELL